MEGCQLKVPHGNNCSVHRGMRVTTTTGVPFAIVPSSDLFPLVPALECNWPCIVEVFYSFGTKGINHVLMRETEDTRDCLKVIQPIVSPIPV